VWTLRLCCAGLHEHAAGWEVKELVKAAHEHQREYSEESVVAGVDHPRFQAHACSAPGH